MKLLLWLKCVLWSGHGWEDRSHTDEGIEQFCPRCKTWRTKEVPE